MTKHLREHGLPLGILLAAALIVLHKTVLFGAWPFVGDVVEQFQPWAEYTRRCFGRGEVPLWNPYNNCGTPFLANLQSAVFYPINLLLLPLPSGLAIGVSNIIHFVIAGWGAYWMTRRFGIGRWGGCLAGMAYMLNGFAMIHLFAGNILTLFAAAWIPWAFLAAEWAFQTKRWKAYLLGASIIWALHFLCGHAQMTFYTAVFTTLYVIVRAAVSHRRSDLAALSRFFTAAAFGIVISAIQFIPTAEYAQNSSRAGGLSYEQATEFSLPPNRIINFFLPDFFGSHADVLVYNSKTGYTHTFWGTWTGWSNNYLGLLPAILAAYVCYWGVRRRAYVGENSPVVFALVLVCVFAFLCAAGRFLPVYQAIFPLPGFRLFRAPSKFTPYLLIPLIVAAGYGFDSLIGRLQARTRIGLVAYRALPFLVMGVILVLIRPVASAILPDHLFHFDKTLPRPVVAIALALFHATGSLLLLIGVWRMSLSSRISALGSVMACLAVVFLDLAAFGSRYTILHKVEHPYGELTGHTIEGASPNLRTVIPGLFNILPDLQNKSNEGRIGVNAFRQLPPYAFLILEIETTGGYDPMSIGRYGAFVASMQKSNGSGTEPRDIDVNAGFVDVIDGPLAPEPRNSYIPLSEPDLGDAIAGLRAVIGSVTRGGATWGFENVLLTYERPAPRSLFIAGSTQPSQRRLPEVPTRQIVIEHPDGSLALIQSASPTPVLFKKAGPQGRRLLEVDAPAEGYLYLSDAYYPGWVARDESGTEYPIVPANHAFRAVKLPAGKHKIMFTYEPASFRIGRNVTLGAIAAWLALLLLEVRGIREEETALTAGQG